jgi:hypothetical protein
MTDVNPATGEVLDGKPTRQDLEHALEHYETAKALLAASTEEVTKIATALAVEDFTTGTVRVTLKSEWKPTIGESELYLLHDSYPNLVQLVPKLNGKALSLLMKSDEGTRRTTAGLLGLEEVTRYAISREERKGMGGK